LKQRIGNYLTAQKRLRATRNCKEELS